MSYVDLIIRPAKGNLKVEESFFAPQYKYFLYMLFYYSNRNLLSYFLSSLC